MKEFELEYKNGIREIKSEIDVIRMLLPAGFLGQLKRMNVNESMFHYDTLTNYTRTK